MTTKKITGVEVTLTQTHTHRGNQCAAGDKITVRPDQAKWLALAGIITTEESK